MSVSREIALEALVAWLSTATWGSPAESFALVTRRLAAPEQMATPGSPGLAVIVHREHTNRQGPTRPPIRTMSVLAIVYIDVGDDETAIPDALLNPIKDALDALFDPLSLPNAVTDGRCTLGGTVFAAFISGETIQAPGDTTGKGIAMVPIDIILP